MLSLSAIRHEAPDDPVARDLAFAVPVLSAPQRVLTAAWRHREAVTVTSLVEGVAGTVLMIDMPTHIVLAPVDPQRAVRTLVDALPTLRPAGLQRFTTSPAALRALAAGHTPKGFGRRAYAAADAAAIGHDALAVLDSVERSKSGQGTLLAVGYAGGVGSPAAFGADWTVGASGAVLKSGEPEGPMTFEAADDAALFRAARAAFQGAKAAAARPAPSQDPGGLR